NHQRACPCLLWEQGLLMLMIRFLPVTMRRPPGEHSFCLLTAVLAAVKRRKCDWKRRGVIIGAIRWKSTAAWTFACIVFLTRWHFCASRKTCIALWCNRNIWATG